MYYTVYPSPRQLFAVMMLEVTRVQGLKMIMISQCPDDVTTTSLSPIISPPPCLEFGAKFIFL
jgi:hypothetical protein